MSERLAPVREGLFLGILAVAGGWGLGVAFGLVEDAMKEGLRRSAEASRPAYLAAAAGEEGAAAAAMAATRDKAWSYYQRAHLHAGGIGAVVIGLCLALAQLEGRRGLRKVASALLGIGAVGYPLFWMLAARRAPGLGSTRAAKESLAWLATPSVGALVVGLAIALGLLVESLYGGGPKAGAARGARRPAGGA
jgi:hypothetical protein